MNVPIFGKILLSFIFVAIFSTANIAFATVTAYQFPNVIADGTLDTECDRGTQITFISPETIQLIDASTASCIIVPGKEDKVKFSVTSTAEEDILTGYLANGGYGYNMIVTGQSTGNEVTLKSKTVSATGYIRLVEINPSTGAVISIIDTHFFAMLANVKYTIIDLSDLTGTIPSGSTFGIKLSIKPDTTTSTEFEVKIGSYDSYQKQILINVDVIVGSDTTPPDSVSNLALSGATQTTIDLDWTAPGDDGGTGTATTYDIRYSTSVINAGNFDSATQATGEPSPSIAGTSENMTVTSLSAGTTYYFAMKTSDEVPNTSTISNLPSLATSAVPDTTSPDAVLDLALSGATTSTIDLNWTAPGDDGGTGTADVYDIRYSTSVINAGNFASATEVIGEFAPSVAGTSENMTVTSLNPNTTYYFAMKTSDEIPNTSTISNVPSLSTLTTPDTTPPDAVSDLALSGATQTTIDLDWTASGDDGGTGVATTYDIRYSTSVINAGNFDSATQATGEPSPSIAGTAESMTVTSLPAGTTYYFAMKTSDEVPNTSLISNIPSLATSAVPSDTTPPGAVSDLAASGATTSTIDLDWTAPGDDGSTGTATTYDIRYSTSAINDGNFASATQVTGEPNPSTSGSLEVMTVSGLSSNTTYYFAMKTLDEVPNTSLISNIPSLTTSEAPTISIPGGGGTTVSTVIFSGQTYPGSEIEVFRKSEVDEIYKNVPIHRSTISRTGEFEIMYQGLLGGEYLFALKAKDTEGRQTGIISFNVNLVQENLEANNILIPPTLGLRDRTVRQGTNVVFEGYAAPNANIVVALNGNFTESTAANRNGYWSISTSTALLSLGNQTVRAKQIFNEIESVSLLQTFRVSKLTLPAADFNKDDTIDITDWSIFLFRWASENKETKLSLDFNSDGIIDIGDFSIFLKSFIL